MFFNCVCLCFQFVCVCLVCVQVHDGEDDTIWSVCSLVPVVCGGYGLVPIVIKAVFFFFFRNIYIYFFRCNFFFVCVL